MKIGPIESFPPAKSPQTTNPSTGSATEEAMQPVSESLPKQKNSVAQEVPSAYELPQDVVEVHQDPEIKDQIIIEYLDTAKNVVLQVPSSEELSVERAIAQEFEQAAKGRPSASSAVVRSEGGKAHGD